MKLKAYKRLEEKEKIVEASGMTPEQQISGEIFRSIRFSMKAVLQAYEIYARISKIIKRPLIPAGDFIQDTTKTTMLQDETWINMFLNSALYGLLNVDTMRDFATQALDNKTLRDDFMWCVYKNKPNNIAQLVKCVNGAK